MDAHRRAILLTAVAVTIIAAPPRFANLGSLSFYADEETTALATRSVLAGEGARMPSGMPYLRALPLTGMAAVSARIFGQEGETAYRIPAALIGVLTVGLFFLFGHRFVGGPAALIAAVFLALSEWHLVFSRQARMYGPFLFFFLAAAYMIWRWAETGRFRDLLGAAALSVVALSFHEFALFLVIVALIPLAFPGWSRVKALGVSAFAVIGGTAMLMYGRVVTARPYEEWVDALGLAEAAEGGSPSRGIGWLLATAEAVPLWMRALGVAGAGLGLWAAHRAELVPRQAEGLAPTLFRYAAAAATGALACTGQLYGAVIGLVVYFLVHPGDRRELVGRLAVPALIIAVVAGVWGMAAIVRLGPLEAAKFTTAFPYRYPVYLAQQFPLLMVLFAGSCAWLAIRPRRSEDRGVRASALAAILMIAALGVVSKWGPTRYLFHAYPFMLLVAAAGLAQLLMLPRRWLAGWEPRRGSLAAVAVVISGLISTHGLPQAFRVTQLDHGDPVNRLVHMFPFRPDHRGPGLFIRGVRQESDVVIAVDPLEQYWYAGQVDYVFRNLQDAIGYTYSVGDGQRKDIYVSSTLLGDAAMIDSIVNDAPGRVWLITSGETSGRRSYYFSSDQLRWLDSLTAARRPAFVGMDEVTSVYCLNCQYELPVRGAGRTTESRSARPSSSE